MGEGFPPVKKTICSLRPHLHRILLSLFHFYIATSCECIVANLSHILKFPFQSLSLTEPFRRLHAVLELGVEAERVLKSGTDLSFILVMALDTRCFEDV